MIGLFLLEFALTNINIIWIGAFVGLSIFTITKKFFSL